MPTSGGAPPHLPSLDNSSHLASRNGSGNTTDGSTSGGGHSASLRGHSFNRVPDICNQPLHTLLPVVKEGWLPPEPYYITQNVVYVTCVLSIDNIYIYTVLHMFRQVLFGAGNQSNHQNFEKSLLTNKL